MRPGIVAKHAASTCCTNDDRLCREKKVGPSGGGRGLLRVGAANGLAVARRAVNMWSGVRADRRDGHVAPAHSNSL